MSPCCRVRGFFFKNLVKLFQLENNKMIQLADLFSVPEIVLLCNLTDYFSNRNVDYDPAILFRDVKV